MSESRPHVYDLPKAELHIHIEGALEPELVFELAERNGVSLPWSSIEELRGLMEFDDLQSFLDLYYACLDVMRTPRDYRDLVFDYVRRASAQGVRHTEPFFDLQAHTVRGIAADDVIDGLRQGLADAEREFGVTGGLIMNIVRDRSVDEALDALESVRGRAGDLLGIGLDSAEVGNPPSLFTEVYARAAGMGLHLVAHAGEEAGPDYVWQALDLLRVERVDHGVRAMEDAALVERLRDHRIPLTVCPLSNRRLQVTPDLSRHPLPDMLAAGLIATVNSDDPAYFGGYVGENFEAVRDDLGLADDTLRELAVNSVRASFADEGRKAHLLAEIDRWR